MTHPCNIIKINKINRCLETPIIILKKRDFEIIGEIKNFTNWKVSFHGTELDEISFDVYKELDGVECEIWDKIVDLAIIELKDYGHFEIQLNTNETTELVKSIVGQSLETELGQLTLKEFHVNNDDSFNGEQTEYNSFDYDLNGNLIPTVFYNKNDPRHSLLHRVLADKAPHWSIGHVPDYIAINNTDKPELSSTFQRSYTVDGTSIYDFLMNDVAQESNVIFTFDTYERKINCYNLEDYVWTNDDNSEIITIKAIGEDTTILIDSENLANQITISSNKDSLKNCLCISGGDDVITDRIRAVNMTGTNYIFSFSPTQLNDMPKELVKKIEEYQNGITKEEDNYYGENGIFTRLCAAYDKYYLYESEMMPAVEITETTAEEQYSNVVNGFNSMAVGVYSLDNYNNNLFVGVTNNIEAMAQIFVDARYKVKVVENTTSYNSSAHTWYGQFKVYRVTDETDTCSTSSDSYISININDDYIEYSRQKILKALNKSSMLDIDFDIANMNNSEIKSYFEQYCRVRLQSFYDGYETCISILMDLKSKNQSVVAEELYHKYDNIRNIVNDVLNERIVQVEKQESIIIDITQEQAAFQEKWNFEKYLGADLYKVFCMYRRDDDYKDDNYISDGLSDSELTAKAKELLDVAKAEIKKSCILQRTVSTDLNNLLILEDFAPIYDKFALFNYIRVKANDELFRLRLLAVEYDSNSPETIHVTFSENIENIDGATSDIKSIYDTVTTISTSYSSTVLQAKSGQEANNEVTNMRNNGLNAAQIRLTNSDNNEVTLGSYGLLCKYLLDEGVYSLKQCRLIGSGLYLTDDGWKTIRACIGETTDGNYGVIADTLIGQAMFSDKFVASNATGSVLIDGNGITISNGIIKSSNYSKENKTGSIINLSDGTFNFAGNKLIYDNNSLFINGNINATNLIAANTGNIGGWEISKNYIRSYTSDNDYVILDSYNKSIYMKSNENKIALASGKLTFYKDETAYCRFGTGEYIIDNVGTGKYGLGINSEYSSTYTSFGHRDENDTNKPFTSYLLLNYGLNPNGYTEKIILQDNTRVRGKIVFNSNFYLNGLSDDNGANIGIYCSGQFNTSGILCIGNTDYGHSLNVNGSGFINGDLYCNNPASSNMAHMIVQNEDHKGGMAVNGDNFGLYDFTWDEWVIRVKADGTVTTKKELSDKRIKHNIQNTKINNALKQILEIKHKEFVFNSNGKYRDIGYIAQELEEINPKMVIPPDNDDDKYSVDSFYLEGIITKAIQEFYQEYLNEITQLKKEINNLKGAVN